MENPWLTIPLEDYEGHMAMPAIGQAKMLADEFDKLLRSYSPKSVAVIGCAGGNGFENAVEAGVSRIVGVDINPKYIAEAKERYAPQIDGLELYCANVEEVLPNIDPVEMVYAALVFEYVHVPHALGHLRKLCLRNGILAALLQLPKEGTEAISPSPFESLKPLNLIMQLVPPKRLRIAAEELGFRLLSRDLVVVESAKQFCLMVFRCP
jgi:SAM-dependent methyltransferase